MYLSHVSPPTNFYFPGNLGWFKAAAKGKVFKVRISVIWNYTRLERFLQETQCRCLF